MIISKRKFEEEVTRRLEKHLSERNAYERIDRLESNLLREMYERDERWSRRFDELRQRMNTIDHKDDPHHCPYKEPVKELASIRG